MSPNRNTGMLPNCNTGERDAARQAHDAGQGRTPPVRDDSGWSRIAQFYTVEIAFHP